MAFALARRSRHLKQRCSFAEQPLGTLERGMARDIAQLDPDFEEIAGLLVPAVEAPAAPTPVWERRSAALMKFARECRARKGLEERLAEVQEKLDALSARFCQWCLAQKLNHPYWTQTSGKRQGQLRWRCMHISQCTTVLEHTHFMPTYDVQISGAQ